MQKKVLCIDCDGKNAFVLFPDGEHMNTKKCLLGNLIVNAMLEGCDVVLNGVKYRQLYMED